MNSPAPSNPSEPDDDPDVFHSSGDAENGSSTPGSPAREQRARVRFNSNAAVRQPRESPDSSAEVNNETAQSTPRLPSILRGISEDNTPNSQHPDEDQAATAAQTRAKHLANSVWRSSMTSSRSSIDAVLQTADYGSDYHLLQDDRDIALHDLTHKSHEQSEEGPTAFKFPSSDSETTTGAQESASQRQDPPAGYAPVNAGDESEKQPKGHLDEIYNASFDGSYAVPKPEQYRGGVLSQLLKLYKQPDLQGLRQPRSESTSPRSRAHGRTPSGASGSGTGTNTPTHRKWYEQNNSQDTLATLIGASANLAKPAQPQSKEARPKLPQKRSRLSHFFSPEELNTVKVHIAGTLARQDFILKLCKALMLYGAPTHRLEEYLSMTARSLEIEGQFLYLPGCMIISFDDTETHTASVQLVRLSQGIDLGRLKDVHRIYKEVLHDVIGVEEATGQLDELMAKQAKFHAWLRVLIFGITSVTAAPFSFHARLIDLPLCFFLGCLTGFLQLIVAPMSPLYSNVLEVTATVIVSFLARAFGSIKGGDLFCFSALAQGGIVMLLPGYMFLSSSLELQARAIVPGSIRIVYGVVYSLLLGFGITIGAALYGLMDPNATSSLTCQNPINGYWTFIFVPPFVLCISMLYQAKWKQMPIMVTIACAGYVVNYFSSLRFSSSPQIASGFGAFAVGTLANLYSRFRHGVAAAILIPAIFTQVPGGLASNGGLLSGLQVANSITNATNTTSETGSVDSNSVVFNVASSMIQIAIGITVGLFVSAVVVYPLGKRRSGLFSF